jgi:N-acetylmuramoyl-L-alanine amidase
MLPALVLLCTALVLPGGALARSCAEGRLRVAVDIGHTKAVPGAISATGKTEWAFNKRFAEELLARGKAWPALHLFALTGENLDLRERPLQAARRGADLFLSIHHDSVQKKYKQYWQHEGKWQEYSDLFKGYSLFVWEGSPHLKDSIAVATLIGSNLRSAGFAPTLHHAEPIPGENRPLLNRKLGVYAAPFAVLRYATMPAVLFEVGIIVNRAEEQELEDPKVRAEIQIQLLSALQEFCSHHTDRDRADPTQPDLPWDEEDARR